ncbi:transglycosylase SLT domain-containing protein [Streptomyces sp. NPDC001407]|uniref:transglycosylase SLT domain-containing protein n=1 Tax=Streptomyces sp. NPDC001407 TaxID=3364573 RepID=UPI0036CDF6A0
MRSTISAYTRLPKAHKLSAAGIAAAGAAALTFAVVPNAFAASDAQPMAVKPVAWNTTASDDSGETQQAQQAAATQAKAAAGAAKTQVKTERADKQAASRSEERKPAPAAPKTYADNLDGWINQALDIMHAKGIPGSYEGVKRNIMRESTGNPQAINNWDSNAVAGIPSKGLLQIIDPTFKAFHVDGTSWDIYDPVANIVASCNYAAHTYGSMDNVNSAY